VKWLRRMMDARAAVKSQRPSRINDLRHRSGPCEDLVVGILDDNTLKLLRDGQVIDTMHRLSEQKTDRTAERGVKLDVQVRDKSGALRVNRVLLKKVRG
jgi:hypothetical protein